MSIELPQRVPTAEEVGALDAQRIASMLQSQALVIEAQQRRIEWFERQLFGSKSERFAPLPDPQQMHLGQVLGQELPVPAQDTGGDQQQVPSHTRRRPRSDFTDDGTSVSFFDESKVPVLTIEVANPEVNGLGPDQYEVVGEKT